MKRPFYSTRVEDNLHWNWLIHPINLSQSEFVFHSNIQSRNYIFLTSQKWPNFNHVTQKRSKNSTVPKLNLYHFLTLIQLRSAQNCTLMCFPFFRPQTKVKPLRINRVKKRAVHMVRPKAKKKNIFFFFSVRPKSKLSNALATSNKMILKFNFDF